ncbi:MAG: glycosyltransferase family 2 protein [Nitrososphaerota archaeon]|nr:glycosyltransferase family 2 protein [Candidatus Bathyarchaeota archaeon]MCX8162787.1 glycosyltransferase family 2 protein [Candidatus Bathyarchaeota archaeon]MDW8061470.1 glycosyltransferase family 2 protein [Nitrososphaerota archaeon]
MVKLSVVIPTYMEAENVGLLLIRLRDTLESIDHEVIIVDDDSPDGTADIAEEYGKWYKNVKVVRRVGVKGLASAIVEGVSKAYGSYIVVMDADMQHPPELIPSMLAKAEDGYDIVVASRYVRGGSVGGWSIARRMISLTATLMARIAIPRVRKLRDPLSGFFLFRRSILEGVNLEPRSCKILVEIIAKTRDAKIYELPYRFQPRYRGESKLGLVEWARYIGHILRLSGYRMFKFAFIGVIGIIVNLSMLVLLVRYLPVWISGLIAIEASILANFVANDLWTFNSRRSRHSMATRMIKYHGAVAIGATINYSILLGLTYIGIDPVTASIVGILLGFVANYTLSETVVWG